MQTMAPMTVLDHQPVPPSRRKVLPRIGAIVGEALLILLTAGLMLAILAPVFKNVSDNPDRYEFFGPPARRQR